MFKNKFAFKVSSAIILPLIIISLIAAPVLVYIVQKEFKASILNTAISQVEASAANTNSYLNTYQNYLQILSKQSFFIENIDDAEQIKNYLRVFPTHNKNINRFVVFDKTGNTVFLESATKVIKTANLSHLPVFKEIIQNGKTNYLSNGLKGPLSGEPIAIAGHAVKDASGTTIGIVAFGMVLEKMDQQTRNISITNSIYNWILDGRDQIIIHPDKSKNLDVNLRKTNSKDILTTSANFASQLKDGVKFFKGEDGQEYISIFSKIPKTPNWVFGATFKKNQLFKPANRAVISYMTIVFVILTIAIGITGFLTFYILRPLLTLLKAMQNIATGDANLTNRIKIKSSSDELGVLSVETNRFIQSINDLIGEVLAEANRVSSSVLAVSKATKSIFNQADQTNKGIFSISTSMREMAKTSEDVSTNTESAAEQVKRANTDTDEGVEQLQNVIKIIENQAKTIETATQDIEILQAEGKQITAVMEVINSIAEQTNLLALNAAIEAARAGDSGRGFAVVADEVRSLALRTHESTAEIQTTISSLNNNIDNAAKAMHQSNSQAEQSVESAFETGNILEKINSSIQKVEDMNVQIASSTQEQTYTAEELSSTLDKIADFSQKTQNDLQQIVNSGEELQNSSQQLKDLMTQFKIS